MRCMRSWVGRGVSLGSKSQKERTGRGGWPKELGEGGGPLGPGNGSYFMDTEQVGRGLHSQSARHEAGGVGRLSFLSRVELRGGSGAVCGLWGAVSLQGRIPDREMGGRGAQGLLSRS